MIQKVLGGKWKIVILFKLKNGTMRFNELYKTIPGISQAILTSQLRDLEKDGVIKRKVYPVIPPKVEYTLSEIGQKLLPALEGLFLWGISYIESENPSS
ncbi:MAG: helix-turn-helix transcriptional regulator [Clostridia bacterium]|nr:helix-turn-helix transcriptional regulator [Clostridia bacterium]